VIHEGTMRSVARQRLGLDHIERRHEERRINVASITANLNESYCVVHQDGALRRVARQCVVNLTSSVHHCTFSKRRKVRV